MLQMSAVGTGQMSAVETGPMSAAETGQLSAVEKYVKVSDSQSGPQSSKMVSPE